MKKELLLTDRTINKYIEFLREQEKSKSTITSYFNNPLTAEIVTLQELGA